MAQHVQLIHVDRMRQKYKQVLIDIDNDKIENFDAEHDECDAGAFSESEPLGNARPSRTRKPPV